MPANIRRRDNVQAGSGDGARSGFWPMEARRREIVRLLEEIRSDRPSRAEIVNAIAAGSNGELSADRLQQIAGSVLSLYR